MQNIKIETKWLWFIPVKINRDFPASWSEVSPRELIAISHLYSGEIADWRFVSIFFRLPPIVARWLDGFHIYKIIDSVEFIQDYTPMDVFIIPKTEHGVAPKPKLGDLSFGRFMFVDTYFNDYASDEKEEALNKFVATLYWPANLKFDENKIPALALKAARLKPETKQAIAINYRLVKDWLTYTYPLVFTKSVNPASVKKESSWLKIFDSIVNDDIINSDKYAEKPLHEILRFITRKIKEHAKRS